MGVDFRWHSGQGDLDGEQPPPPRRRLRWRPLLVAGLALALAAGALVWRSQRGLRAARQDLQTLVRAEVRALAAGDRQAFLDLIDSSDESWLRYQIRSFPRQSAWYAARAGFDVQVEGIRLARGRAAVSCLLPEGAQARRATWFYRLVEGRWRHAPPPAEAWGGTCQVQMAHVTVHAPGLDCDAALRVARELDGFYARLWQLYHPPGPAGAAEDAPPEPLALCVTADGAAQEALTIPSPQLALEMWTPDERVAFLAQAARLRAARAVLGGDREPGSSPAGWLYEGLALWHAGAWQPEWQGEIQASLADGGYRHFLDAHIFGLRPNTPFWALRELPMDGERARALAYAFADLLVRTCPPERLRAALRAAAQAPSALEDALGLDRQHLAAAWSRDMAERHAKGN